MDPTCSFPYSAAYDNVAPNMSRAFPAEPLQGFLPVGLALAFTDEEHLRPTKSNTVDRFLLDPDEGVLQLFVQYALSVAGAADREKAHRDFFNNYGSDSSLPRQVYGTKLGDEEEGASDEEEGASEDEERAPTTTTTTATDEEGATAAATNQAGATTTTTSSTPSIALSLSTPPPSPRTLAPSERQT